MCLSPDFIFFFPHRLGSATPSIFLSPLSPAARSDLSAIRLVDPLPFLLGGTFPPCPYVLIDEPVVAALTLPLLPCYSYLSPPLTPVTRQHSHSLLPSHSCTIPFLVPHQQVRGGRSSQFAPSTIQLFPEQFPFPCWLAKTLVWQSFSPRSKLSLPPLHLCNSPYGLESADCSTNFMVRLPPLFLRSITKNVIQAGGSVTQYLCSRFLS